jgi:peptidyl-prolyl cis-trans isomerase SurA
MTLRRLALLALFTFAVPIHAAQAIEQGVIATVNDFPITKYDIEQRMRLMAMLGGKQDKGTEGQKRALRAMIDDRIKIAEATKFKAQASEREIDAQVKRIAKGLSTDNAGLESKLKAQGIEMSLLRQYVAASIAMNRILAGRYQVKLSDKVDQAEVDKKFAEIKQQVDGQLSKIMKDPRMQPVSVYSIMQIELPVEVPDDPGLLQARAIEANQFISRFKSCKSAQAAASGIFNVKISKPIDAVAAKMPPQLRQALDKAGPGRAVGPSRGPKGIQVLAFCGKRTITPPKPKYQLPTRQQVENAVSNEKFAATEEKYMKIMRQNALVEYKDPKYALSQ